MNLISLKEGLTHVLRGKPADNHGPLHEASDLLAATDVNLLLEPLLHDRRRLREIALRSRIDPRGFDRLVLLSCLRPAYEVQLHIWWPRLSESFPQGEVVHSSQFDITSIVASGACRLRVFRKIDRGKAFYEYRHSPRDAEHDDSIELFGEASLEHVFEIRLKTDNSFVVAREELRQIIPDQEKVTSTLLLCRTVNGAAERFFSRRPLSSRGRGPAHRLSESSVSDRIRQYLSGVRFLENCHSR